MCEMISVRLSATAIVDVHTSTEGQMKGRLPIIIRESLTRPGLLSIGFGDSTNFEARPRMHDCVSPMYCVSGNDCLPLKNNKRKANPIPSVVASFLPSILGTFVKIWSVASASSHRWTLREGFDDLDCRWRWEDGGNVPI